MWSRYHKVLFLWMRRQDSQRGQIILLSKVLQSISGRLAYIFYINSKSYYPCFLTISNSSTKLCNNLFCIHFSFNLRHVSCLYKLIFILYSYHLILLKFSFYPSDPEFKKSNSAKRPKTKTPVITKAATLFLMVFNSIILKKMFMLLCLPSHPAISSQYRPQL